MEYKVVDALVTPYGHLDMLSKMEVSKLLDNTQGGLYSLFRNCSLAVLSSDSYLDSGKELLERYPGFAIRVVQVERGIKLPGQQCTGRSLRRRQTDQGHQ